MLASIIQLLTGRYVTLVALVAVTLLGLALTATSVTAAKTEAQLRARIAELTRVNTRQAAYWNAKLTHCDAGGGPAGAGESLTNISAEERARRLATREPAGFDVCARMESADRAVLENLR